MLITVVFDTLPAARRLGWQPSDEMNELRELATSSGCQVVAEIIAKRHRPVAATLLGEGKIVEIAQTAAHHRASVVIVNQELSSAQQRNIEEVVQVKTIDRTQLILDIFAQRAKSEEGKLQVELAQLRYLLPRLTGKGVLLSRLGGGIGTRGPGEQKLEVDRRRIRARITRLSRALEQLRQRREATRARRKKTGVPVAALIGYTNAGKTTLLNRLTGAEGIARNQLFTTLDPLARQLWVPPLGTVIVTDTVGFLHHLPHHLVEAFHATLEETQDADLLLHIVDAGHPLVGEHVKAVEEVLKMLACEKKPRITLFNKSDLVTDRAQLAGLETAYQPALSISAMTGEGIDRLTAMLSEQLVASPIES